MRKVNLFALTGFGNGALHALQKQNICINRLYTRKEKGLFPYFSVEPIDDIAKQLGISVIYIDNNTEWDVVETADINLVVSFHRILKKKHLSMARYNINVHPSLLPSYKGPTPTNWMIEKNEKICGISAHLMTHNIDEGTIIFQKEYPLMQNNDPDLRKFLASKIEFCVNRLIDCFEAWKVIKNDYPESYYPSFHEITRKEDV